MSLDNIQLPAVVLQELFRHSLVLGDIDKAKQPAVKPASFSILGNNKKKILILVADDENLHLPDEQLSFLLGILSACKLSMEDVAILNIKKNPNVGYTALNKELKAQQILLFGVDPAAIDLPLQFPYYQVQAYNNQTYLSAPLLTALQADKAEKTKLWNALKQVFSL